MTIAALGRRVPALDAGYLLPAVFGFAAAVLSFIGSWVPSLWGDEAATILSAERPLPSLFVMLGHVDAVHGTYYVLMHFWVAAFGASPVAVRLPSALAVGLAVAGAVALAARLASVRTTVLVGVVCAVLPRLTYAGEESRGYALGAAIAAWLTVLLVRLLRDRRRWPWIVYGALLTAGVYVFLFLGLIVLAHLAILLSRRSGRRVLMRWVAAVAAGLVVTVPLVYWALRERHQVAYLSHRNELTAHAILVGPWFSRVGFAVAAWSLIATGLALAVVTWRRRRRTGVSRSDPSLELVAVCWMAIPSGVLIASSVLVPDFTDRYLTFCAPAAGILVACGLDRLAGLAGRHARGRTAIAALLAAVTVAVAAPVYVAQRGPFAMNHSDWAQIAATIGDHARPGDGILFDESNRPSRRTRLSMQMYPKAFAGLRDITLDVPYARNITWHDSAYTVEQAVEHDRLNDVSRVWVVEYAEPSHTDTWGIAGLQAAGYTVAARYRDHRSVILEFDRSAAPCPAGSLPAAQLAAGVNQARHCTIGARA